MADIQKGVTFLSGQVVTADLLNNLVDQALNQPGLIGDKGGVALQTNDEVLVRDVSANQLKRATVQDVNLAGGGVVSVALLLPTGEFNVSGTPITSAGTFICTWKPVSGNKVLVSPADGSSGSPVFRDLLPQDVWMPSVLIAAQEINWDSGYSFHKSLSGSANFTFTHSLDGRTIHVALVHNGYGATWPASIRWANGVQPVPTLETSIFKFTVINGLTYGWLEASGCKIP
jgi:hypothetical protein